MERTKYNSIPYATPPAIKDMKPLDNFGYINTILDRLISGDDPKIERINETGPRKTGKSESWFIASMWSIFQSHQKIDVYWVRNKVGDADELYTNFEEYLQGYDVSLQKHSNKTKRIIKYKTNQLRVLGLETGRIQRGKSDIKVGLKRAKGKQAAIVVFEERHEISDDKVQAVMEAVGGYKHIVQVHISNPWLISNEYIRYCHKRMPYRDSILKDKREEQFQVIDREIFHYSQHTLNPYISQSERSILDRLQEIDPRRSRVANYGLPGAAEGTIYDGYIHNVETPTGHYLRPAEFKVGIDLARTRDDWVVLWGGIGYNDDWVAIYDMYRHNNLEQARFKTINEMVEDTIQFIKRKVKENPQAARDGIEAEVDYAWPGVIEMLNARAEAEGMTYITFRDCLKHSINKRVDEVSIAMNLKKIWIDRDKCQHLINEFETSMWDEKITDKPKRLDKDDHSINAFEYLIAHMMTNMVQEFKGYVV